MALTDVCHSSQLRGDAPQIHLAGDAENGSETGTAPAIPVNPDPNMPLSVYREPSVLPSEDLTSSFGGPSLTPSNLATSDNVRMPRPTRSVEWPELHLHLEDDEKIRNTPFEIEPEALPMSSTTVTAGGVENQFPLPWKLEFRWEGGQVNFSCPHGSVLVSFSRQSIAISSAAFGSSNGFSESTHVSAVLVLGDDVCLNTAVWLEDEAYWARKVRRGALVRLLIDHYLRSHTSQGANRRNGETAGGQHSTTSPSSAPFLTTTPVRPSAGGGSSRHLVNGGGSGGSEDDDPGDGGRDQSRNPENPVRAQKCYFACPYQKYRAHLELFKQCFNLYRDPSEVKGHIFEKHYVLRCPECHRPVKTPRALAQHSANTGCGGNPTPDPTPGNISEQQYAELKKKPRGQNREQQWRNIFRIIFPNEPQPCDIFVDGRADKAMQQIARDWQTCCRLVLPVHQAQQARDDPFSDQFDTPRAQREAVAKEFTPWLMLELHGQEPLHWSLPLAPDLNTRNYSPGTFAPGSSPLPSDRHQPELELNICCPLTLDALRQNDREFAGFYSNFQAGRSSRVSPLPPDWLPGSQVNMQPITPFNVGHAALGYQPMTANALEQPPPVVPQLGQDFDAQLHPLPNEDVFETGSQQMFRPGSHNHDSNNNDNDGMNIVMSTYSSTLAGVAFSPGTHGLSPAAVAGGCWSALIPTNDAYGNATMTAATTFNSHHTQQVNMMGSNTLSYPGSSYRSYQDTLTNGEVVPLSFLHYDPEKRAFGKEPPVISCHPHTA